MPRLVHLARESTRRSIARAGIRGAAATVPVGAQRGVRLDRAVYAMPVLPDFSTTFQWLRELRRWHGERMIAVHFTLPKDSEVWVGRYGGPHRLAPVGAASRWVAEHPLGAEVIVPRSISTGEIRAVRETTQLVGWTETPEPSTWECLCQQCLPPGMPKTMRRVRAAYDRAIAAARAAESADAVREALFRVSTPLERARGRLPPAPLLAFARHPHPNVRKLVAACLADVRWKDAEATLLALLGDPDFLVQCAAADALVHGFGVARARAVLAHPDLDPDARGAVEGRIADREADLEESKALSRAALRRST
jgi:hypothetical protein